MPSLPCRPLFSMRLLMVSRLLLPSHGLIPRKGVFEEEGTERSRKEKTSEADRFLLPSLSLPSSPLQRSPETSRTKGTSTLLDVDSVKLKDSTPRLSMRNL